MERIGRVISENMALERVQNMILSRYGKSFHLLRLTAVEDQIKEHRWYWRKQSLHIPLFSKSEFLGTGMIPLADDLPTEDIETLADLVKLNLIPPLYINFLDRVEQNLKIATEQGIHNDPVDQVPFTSFDQQVDLDKIRQEFKKFIALVGEDRDFASNMSIRIHALTENWAYIRFTDIKSILNDVQDLKKCSGMTVYIDSVEDLNINDMLNLVTYASRPDLDEGPIFILHTVDPYKLPTVLIKNNCLELNRIPLDGKMQDEVIDLFLTPHS